MKQVYYSVLLAIVCTLTGCQGSLPAKDSSTTASSTGHDTKVATPQDNVPAEALLEYARYFTELSAETQKKEVSLLSSQNKPSRLVRSKLALAYGLPASKARDALKAQILLDELVQDKTLAIEDKTLFTILRDYNAESLKLSSRIRDEQKRADTAQTSAASLQKKLDDLKNIEKAMIDRDQGSRK